MAPRSGELEFFRLDCLCSTCGTLDAFYEARTAKDL